MVVPVYGNSAGSSYSLTLRTDERVVTWFVIWEEESFDSSRGLYRSAQDRATFKPTGRSFVN